ncbi:MAG: undecaprenyldiphospho-muramoylpentapeptide beta-N-acetylglucosaminyltransferase [Bacteroidota bacterium]
MKNTIQNNFRFLFAGGGTGGHLFPALSIAESLKNINSNFDIRFVGTKNKIEAKVVPTKGYKFYSIWISGFHRKFTIENLLFPFKLIFSLLQSFILLKNFKPNVVVGTGGFVCGPILYVAEKIGIPTVIHESNSYPGVTTKLLASNASLTLLGFETTKKYLSKKSKCEFVGTPTREIGTIEKKLAVKFFSFDGRKKVLLVFGGSLGATSINNAIEKNLKILKETGMQIIWQTGKSDFENFKKYENKQIRVLPFINEMNMAFSAADIIVCRSGAMSVSEVLKAQKKAIFVPYPFAAANHQQMNAEEAVKYSVSEIISDDEIQNKLIEKIKMLLSKKETTKNVFKKNDVSKIIAKKIIQLANGKN